MQKNKKETQKTQYGSTTLSLLYYKNMFTIFVGDNI